ncbi:MAG: hypothetical protein M1142_01005 [Patescibacteria group bacterium]|nr:hypothetical protein [Patescibacteria group bacterium]
MKQKGFVGTPIFIGVVILAFITFQYFQYNQKENKNCGGDWNYNTQCPVGTFCQSSSQGPFAGGACKPYLSGIFEVFSNKDNITNPPGKIIQKNVENLNPTTEPDTWETYTNARWGVSFDHPKSWQIKSDTSDSVELVANNSQQMLYFYYINNPQNLTLEEIDQENMKKYQENGQVGFDPVPLLSKSSVLTQVGKYQAYYEKEFFCEPSLCQRYVIPYKGKVIMIELFPDSYTSTSGNITTKILSTFKFLPDEMDENQGQENKITQGNLDICQVDSDCIVVPYTSCCGATKKAINKKYLTEYNSHPDWQKFDDRQGCTLMGVCPADSNITKATCQKSDDNLKRCQLKF